MAARLTLNIPHIAVVFPVSRTMRLIELRERRDSIMGNEHGIKHAFYSNLPGPNQTAWIEYAGREMDLHLKGVLEVQQL